MIQVSEVLNELYGVGKSVVGLRQPADPTYAILTGANLESSSGVYLEGGLVTVPNIHESQNYDSINATTFNQQIGNYIKDSIINACNLVFERNDQLEYGLLYNNKVGKTDTLDNATDFVGYQVNALKRADITALINSLIAEFDADGSVTIYLFHSSQQTALNTQAITLSERNAIEQAVNWTLEKHKQFGGCFYIGYFTSGLTPKAINRNNDDSGLRNQYLRISYQPVKFTNVTGVELPDITNVEFTSDTYGLNFNLSVLRDYTDYIIKNKNRFASVIKYQFQADMLRLMSTVTDRSSIIERGVDRKALRELEGILTENDKVYSQGILRKLENEAHRLYREFINKEEHPTIKDSIR